MVINHDFSSLTGKSYKYIATSQTVYVIYFLAPSRIQLCVLVSTRIFNPLISVEDVYDIDYKHFRGLF